MENYQKTCRRTKSKKIPDDFLQALDRCYGRFKAEKLPEESYYELYSQTELIKRMMIPDNQVVWGRRGTGKTHLLKAFCQKINMPDNNQSMAIYISCEDLQYESPDNDCNEISMHTMKKYSKKSFKLFMNVFINKILTLINVFSKKNIITKKQKDEVDKILLEIMALIESQRTTPTVITKESSEETEEKKIEISEQHFQCPYYSHFLKI